MSILHPGLNNGGYLTGGGGGNSLTTGELYVGNGGGQAAMGTSSPAQGMQNADAYFTKQFMESHRRVNVVVDTVENGFVMTINEKKFVCSEPKELGDMLIAHMVAQRVSK
jgi:hypothetical protein